MRLLIVALAGALCGCATTGTAPKEALQSVQPGMKRAEVIALLGEPGNRSFREDVEALQYCRKAGPVADYLEFDTVWLRNATVAAYTTARRKIILASSCSNFPAVDWSQAPR